MPGGTYSIPFITGICHGLPTAGLSKGVADLTAQLFQQFQSRNSYVWVELIHVAGDEEGDIINH
jgi:hypothetical protein